MTNQLLNKINGNKLSLVCRDESLSRIPVSKCKKRHLRFVGRYSRKNFLLSSIIAIFLWFERNQTSKVSDVTVAHQCDAAVKVRDRSASIRRKLEWQTWHTAASKLKHLHWNIHQNVNISRSRWGFNIKREPIVILELTCRTQQIIYQISIAANSEFWQVSQQDKLHLKLTPIWTLSAELFHLFFRVSSEFCSRDIVNQHQFRIGQFNLPSQIVASHDTHKKRRRAPASWSAQKRRTSARLRGALDFGTESNSIFRMPQAVTLQTERAHGYCWPNTRKFWEETITLTEIFAPKMTLPLGTEMHKYCLMFLKTDLALVILVVIMKIQPNLKNHLWVLESTWIWG